MQIQEFEALASAYGGDIRRWPGGQREAAAALVKASARARTALAEVAALDRLLDASPAAQPSLELRTRVLAGAPRAPAARLGARLGLWLSGAGLAAAGVAGLMVGMATSSAAVESMRTEALVAQALPDDGGGLLSLWTVSTAAASERAG